MRKLSFDNMTDEMLGDEINGLFMLQSVLMVHSQLPKEHREQYQKYQDRINELEAEQDKRAKGKPSVGQHDTLHILW